MVRSQNKSVDLAIKATNLNGLTSNGQVMVGNKAFEYYNDKNKADFIQIPYGEIDYITAEVLFGKKIVRFAIHTKSNRNFIFSTRDNKKTLRAVNKYLPDEKLRKSLGVMDYIKKSFKKK
ncbi:MAG: DUF956 family protein [Anaerococcus sp.]|nr:DUF956 family protein [Anaerococcus sp.]